ncbi:MAG: Fe-S cluster assembly protein SufB [bacterium]|nr:Fe-S cluster assembly protein SufB [bacterium]
MPSPTVIHPYQYGFHDEERHVRKVPRGLSRRVVEMISSFKNEPKWMSAFRLQALSTFEAKQMPNWGADLSGINFDAMTYYLKPTDRTVRSWDEVPDSIKKTFDRIGVPEAEKKFLAGVGAQYDSESIYHNLKKELEDQGVIFKDMDSGLRDHPDLVREYFGRIVPPHDNKFSALNSAVWSGGSFVYIPANVHVKIPLQAYFRINARNMGQFERTLIIAEEGSSVHYVEGCSAPIYTTDSLHAAVVEIVVKKGATVQYTTIQNWSSNVYNLVTKRMSVHEDGTGIWTDANIGSKVTMKYPSCYLIGKGARGDILSIALAGKGQHQDAGGKALHLAPHTSSTIISKSISYGGGRTSFRGLLKVRDGAYGSKSHVRCDALILDEHSRSDTYPTIQIDEKNVTIGHEAVVSKVGEEQLFYLQSRGLTEAEAMAMIVNGFIEPIVRNLPMEYAVEMNRLIQLEMEGVG